MISGILTALNEKEYRQVGGVGWCKDIDEETVL